MEADRTARLIEDLLLLARADAGLPALAAGSSGTDAAGARCLRAGPDSSAGAAARNFDRSAGAAGVRGRKRPGAAAVVAAVGGQRGEVYSRRAGTSRFQWRWIRPALRSQCAIPASGFPTRRCPTSSSASIAWTSRATGRRAARGWGFPSRNGSPTGTMRSLEAESVVGQGSAFRVRFPQT